MRCGTDLGKYFCFRLGWQGRSQVPVLLQAVPVSTSPPHPEIRFIVGSRRGLAGTTRQNVFFPSLERMHAHAIRGVSEHSFVPLPLLPLSPFTSTRLLHAGWPRQR